MICTHCNNNMPEDSLFCPYCGSQTKNVLPPSIQEPVNDITTSQKHHQLHRKNSVRPRYCRRCGSLIHADTKKCAGCGKQYFKGIRFGKSTATLCILILLFAVCISLITYQHISNTKLQEQLRNFETSITDLQDQIDALGRRANAQYQLIDILKDRIEDLERQTTKKQTTNNPMTYSEWKEKFGFS